MFCHVELISYPHILGGTGESVTEVTLDWARRIWCWPLIKARGLLDGLNGSLHLHACSYHCFTLPLSTHLRVVDR